MISTSKQESALRALQQTIITARFMAYRGEPSAKIAKILDHAEVLPTLFTAVEDRTEEFRQANWTRQHNQRNRQRCWLWRLYGPQPRWIVKQSLFLSLFALILGTACFAGEQQVRKAKVLAPGLTVEVPEGFTITRHKPTEDFELLVFKSGTNTILKLYLGNQPDFPKEKTAGPVQKETINGFHVESVKQKKPDGTISREVLFHLRDNGIWPQRMHCWYANLSARQSAEAEQIVSSVHLADKPIPEKAP
jgi:hypothetical protein